MKKNIFVKKLSTVIFTLTIGSLLFAEQTASQIVKEAAEKDSASLSVKYIEENLKTVTVPSEKRALYAFLGSLQEQMSLYQEASRSYASAAGISAGDAAGMPKKSSQQLVLDAVRASLSYGDFSTADSYLNSAVRNSSDEKVQSYIKLYEVWSALCKINSASRLEESVTILKAYSTMPSMKAVCPSVLLTLWYVTGENEYGESLKKQFPASPEANVVSGAVQMLPAPFWYFMPKKGEALASAVENAVESQPVIVEKSKESNAASSAKKQQLGLFRSRDNAASLCDALKAKNFDAYILEEKRSSGTTYFIVVVDENEKGTMGNLLKSAGFECYPVF